MRKDRNRIGALFAGAFLLAVGTLVGFLWGQHHILQREISIREERPDQAVNLMIDFGGGDIRTFIDEPIGDGETLLAFMERVVEKNGLSLVTRDFGGDLGKQINQIGERRDGESGRFWQYWVNNRFAKVGVSFYPLSGGDIITWQFVPQQPYE